MPERKLEIRVRGGVDPQVREQTVQLRENLKSLTEAVRGFSKALETIGRSTAAFRDLNVSIATTTRRMDGLASSGAKASGSIRELGTAAKLAITQLSKAGQAGAALDRVKLSAQGAAQALRPLANSKTSFDSFIKNIRAARDAMSQLGRSTRSIAAFVASLKEAKDAVRLFSKEIGNLINLAHRLNAIEDQMSKMKKQLAQTTRMAAAAQQNFNAQARQSGPATQAGRQNVGLLISGLKQLSTYLAVTGYAMIRFGNAIINGFKGAIDFATRFSGQMNATVITMTKLLGSAPAARSFLATLQNYALRTPITFQDISEGARKLLGFGVAAKEVIPVFDALTNATAGDLPKINRAILQLAQIRASPTLQARNLTVLSRSIPGVQGILAKQLNVPVAQVFDTKKLNLAGKDAADAIIRGLQERFGGISEKISLTPMGIIQNIKDALEQIVTSPDLNGIGDRLLAGLKPGLQAVLEFLYKLKTGGRLGELTQAFEQFGQTISTAIQRTLPFLEKILDVFTRLSPQVQNFILSGTLLVGVLSKVAGSLTLLSVPMTLLIGSLAYLIKSAGGILPFFIQFGPLIAGIAIALPVVAAGVVHLVKSFQDGTSPIRKIIDDFAEFSNLGSMIGPMTEEQATKFGTMKTAIEGMKQAWDGFIGALSDVGGRAFKEIGDAFGLILQAPQSGAGAIQLLTTSIQNMTRVIKSEFVSGLVDGIGTVVHAFALIAEAILGIISLLRGLNDLLGGFLGWVVKIGVQFLVIRRFLSPIIDIFVRLVVGPIAGLNAGLTLAAQNTMRATGYAGNLRAAFGAVALVVATIGLEIWNVVRGIKQAREEAAAAKLDSAERAQRAVEGVRSSAEAAGFAPLQIVGTQQEVAKTAAHDVADLIKFLTPTILPGGGPDIPENLPDRLRKILNTAGVRDSKALREKVNAQSNAEILFGGVEGVPNNGLAKIAVDRLRGGGGGRFDAATEGKIQEAMATIRKRADLAIRQQFTGAAFEVAGGEATAGMKPVLSGVIGSGQGISLGPQGPLTPGAGTGKKAKISDLLRPYREALKEAEDELKALQAYGGTLEQIAAQSQVVAQRQRDLQERESELRPGALVKDLGIRIAEDEPVLAKLNEDLKTELDAFKEGHDTARMSTEQYQKLINEIFYKRVAAIQKLVSKGQLGARAGNFQIGELGKQKRDIYNEQEKSTFKQFFDDLKANLPEQATETSFSDVAQKISAKRASLITATSRANFDSIVQDTNLLKELWEKTLDELAKKGGEFADRLLAVSHIRTVADAVGLVSAGMEKTVHAAGSQKTAFAGVRTQDTQKALAQLGAFQTLLDDAAKSTEAVGKTLDQAIAGPAKDSLDVLSRMLDGLQENFRKIQSETPLTAIEVTKLHDAILAANMAADSGDMETAMANWRIASELTRVAMERQKTSLEDIIKKSGVLRTMANEQKDVEEARAEIAAKIGESVLDYTEFSAGKDRIQTRIRKKIRETVTEFEKEFKKAGTTEGQQNLVVGLQMKIESLNDQLFKAMISDSVTDAFRQGANKFFEGVIEGKASISAFFSGIGEGLKNVAKEITSVWTENLIKAFAPSPLDAPAQLLSDAAQGHMAVVSQWETTIQHLNQLFESWFGGGGNPEGTTETVGQTQVSRNMGGPKSAWGNVRQRLLGFLGQTAGAAIGSSVAGGGPGAGTGAVLGTSILGPGIGAQLGHMFGSLTGPVGMVLGGVVGGFAGKLFGKGGGNDAGLELDRRRNSLLNEINHQLRPVSDYFHFLSRMDVFGPASAHFGGRMAGYGTSTGRGGR